MTKARTLANFISDGSTLADGAISVSEVSGAAPLANPTFTGTASGTFSGPLTGNVAGNLTGDVTGDVTGDLDLAAIAATKSDTAVDVFVYDTSKDSDGGAWRKRTQGTSWYNEALNTTTRGSRKEFPSVAVIVVDNDGLYIYDGDDPNLPMWMKANDVSSGMLLNGSNANAVTAKNGIIALAASSAFWVMHFVDDRGDLRNSSRRYDYKGNIEQRNDALGYIDQETSGALVHHVINDVAMTVLPNAPIDAATGLPVPTIAIASDGGVSVIKDDGTVVDITGTSQGSDMPIDQISFVGNHSVIFSHRYASEVSTIPSSDSNAAYYNQVPTFTGRITNSITHNDDTHLAALSSDNNIESIAIDEDNAVSKSVSGVSRHNHFAIAGDTDRASAFITSTYNTGWMNGAIKLATLSDTDDTNVTGAELVTNGTFDSDVSGWAGEADTTATYDSGRLKVTKTSSSGPYGIVRTDVTTVVGKQYLFQADSITGSGPSAFFRFNDGALGAYTETEGTTHRAYFTATTTNTRVALGVASTASAQYIFWDNVSVQEVEEDRSVNGNGLQVFGTVTKNPVATGADLVGYSGFSGSNYLQQPYNAGLDFGTGDFSIMFWFKTPDKSAAGTLFHRSSNNIGDGSWATNAVIQIEFNTSSLYGLVGTNGFSVNTGPNVPLTALSNDVWHQYAMVRRSGRIAGYIDSKFIADAANVLTTTNTTAKVHIGERPVASRVFNGSLALFRSSATAPSPEQIAKIYNDEKVLFQDGAQATLYGTSDAVTALAHDDTTDLLHVGTSAGRSVFQGLRRVENTTDAVGTAISASNGLVVEE